MNSPPRTYNNNLPPLPRPRNRPISRLRPMNSDAINNVSRNLNFENDDDDIQQVQPPQQINTEYAEFIDSSNQTCPVCLDRQANVKVHKNIDGIGHYFCDKCLLGIANYDNQRKCPLCRSPSSFFGRRRKSKLRHKSTRKTKRKSKRKSKLRHKSKRKSKLRRKSNKKSKLKSKN